MTAVPFIDIFGYWMGIFLTFAILSFLYKDNPFYKFAEHIFIGVSVGYLVVRQTIDVLLPKLITPLKAADSLWAYALAGMPIALSIMMLFKLSKQHGWVGRYPVAFVVALFAGLQINSVPNADLVKQIEPATQSVIATKMNINEASVDQLVQLPGVSPKVAKQIADSRPISSLDELPGLPGLSDLERASLSSAFGPLQGLEARATVAPETQYDWFGTFSNVLLLLGLVAGLIYFYFSVAHTGTIGRISRFGVWVLMIGFGASFGYTVQGRISLAIGRAMDVLGQDKSPEVAAQIHGTLVALVVIAIIVAGIVAWERKSQAGKVVE